MRIDENPGSEKRVRKIDAERRKQNKPFTMSDRRKPVDRRNQADRRLSKRIFGKITARINLAPNDISEKWDIIFLDNIGVGGAKFKFNQNLNIGTIIEMKVSFPGELEFFSCKAKVMRVQKAKGSPMNEISAHLVGMDRKKILQISQVTEKLYTPGIKRIYN